jgi:hypothetical protein
MTEGEMIERTLEVLKERYEKWRKQHGVHAGEMTDYVTALEKAAESNGICEICEKKSVKLADNAFKAMGDFCRRQCYYWNRSDKTVDVCSRCAVRKAREFTCDSKG